METVFITIHDLSSDARIKYCSESIEYILGYSPHEVKGKSCWEYFHPAEIPFAKYIHGQSLGLDKAAVFNYCRVRHKDGSWVGCECVFTVVFDVIIASTAIYQRGSKAQSRADNGAQIRRIFSSSPRDVRYQMLSYISNKFYQESQPHAREPRAALFLNRFTRTSTIMFATNGVADILGVEPGELTGKSFYYCIAQSCLDDAIRCLESAKANDSIAYLRFWYRDPAHAHDQSYVRQCSLADGISDDEDEDDNGGVLITSGSRLSSEVHLNYPDGARTNEEDRARTDAFNQQSADKILEVIDGRSNGSKPGGDEVKVESQSRSSSGESYQTHADAIFDPPTLQHHESTASNTPENEMNSSIELEAVVSCTSDGLVLVLRRARPLTPHGADPTATFYANGLFATPWAKEPVLPDGLQRSDIVKVEKETTVDGAVSLGFMQSIRDVAVFAWSLTSINGSLANHARGTPTGEALPAGGLPVWDPTAQVDEKENDRWNGFATSTHRPIDHTEPNATPRSTDISDDAERDSSEDEILWKRVPQQPPWKRPKRKFHSDALEVDGDHGRTDEEHEKPSRPHKTIRR